MNFIKKYFIKKLWFWIIVVLILAATFAIRSGWVGDMLGVEKMGTEERGGGGGYYEGQN